ncbi:Putative membrane protein [Corynebacterium glyciniphilum AJ 3170]|uniref:Putative membrane protein n=1 Tax=Corynebacterium glyciniphilum AJ 3170 TaxID=1404245 RepID=X5E7M4_9CORY|nr:acyltransferase family protein [Corynebacterium glyciniphilum]AHW62686.1 Putative membrane protein [Corynebacterium glyciniphilum AJ 3170]
MNGREPFVQERTAPAPRSALRRTDIDGLRGLAIALVVVFHVFVGRVSAGVDVFLLLGGIFFFSPQIRNALNPAGLTVVQSFLRIFRRLYPALVTVVGVSLIAALVVYAPVRWSDAGMDAAASLLYLQNLNLSAQGNDYASISTEVSVFQHIWSMSVQMQIYLGSLIVIALVAVVFRRRSRRDDRGTSRAATGMFALLLGAATLASFIYATWLSGHDQGANYYSPLSRFWEIGLGGLFGMVVLGRVLPAVSRRLRLIAGVVGVALIICTGLFLDGAAQFPGPWTLVPLVGAMLVILSGNQVAGERDPRPTGVTALLSTAPFQFLGRTAYSLYLWHWPILTLATFLVAGGSGAESSTEASGGSPASSASGADGLQGVTATLGGGTGAAVGAGVIGVSLLLAWLTLRLIELPLQQTRRPRRSWVVGDRAYLRAATQSRGKASVAAVMVVTSAAVMVFGPTVSTYNETRAATLATEPLDVDDYPGPAAFLADAEVPDGVDVVPDTTEVGPMMPKTQDDGCFAGFSETELILTEDFNDSDVPCAYGDTEADRTMYLAGGSHSEHFLPALDEIGQEQGIRIVPILKMGCVVGMALPRVSGDDYPECAEWQQKAQDYIVDNPPTDGVFMTVTRPTTIRGDGPDLIPPEYVDVIGRFSDAGIHTWGVRDTPWLMTGPGAQLDARVCIAEERDGDCGVAQDDALLPANPALSALDGLDVTHVDLTPAVCHDGRCPGVVGNVLVYRDTQHLTDRFSELLAPEISRQMFDPEAQVEQSEAAEAAENPADEAGPRPGPDVFRLPKPGEDGYVEPEEPDDPEGSVEPDAGWVDPGYVDPGWVDPGYVDPGYIDPGWAPAY